MNKPDSDATRPATRDRLLAEALRLFSERDYDGTSVAAIEEAAGLAPGRGGLYRHFPSKEALLAAAAEHEADRSRHLVSGLRAAAASGDGSVDAIEAIAWAGLQRLRSERHLTRLLIRDLQRFPEQLATVADSDIRPAVEALAGWLEPLVDPDQIDALALAAVLVGAITQLWLLEDLFGKHPAGVDTARYVSMLARLCAAAIASPAAGPRAPAVDSGSEVDVQCEGGEC